MTMGVSQFHHGKSEETTMRVLLCFYMTVLTLAGSSAFAQIPRDYPARYQKIIEAAKKEGSVRIDATTNKDSVVSLIQGFTTTYPGIKVEYNDMSSTELYNRYAAGNMRGDVVWDSSMDSALQLAKNYALPYRSPEKDMLPSWAVWKNLAYGTTYEPVVFIYNKLLLSPDVVPTTHTTLAKLAATQTDMFKNKITTYDIEKSAVGFTLAVQDKIHDPNYFNTLHNLARGGLFAQSSTGTMMERVSSGETLIGYNILGCYAQARARTDKAMAIVYPSDYTLVLSRVAFINKKARHPNAAKLWLDYLLSRDGQTILANQAEITSIRTDISGDNNRHALTQKLGETILKPIPVNETLLHYLQPKPRLEFIKNWRIATGK
jgi:iron(III) transport system substrate-binding protein